MGTIKASIAINDRMTAPIRAMNSAMNQMLSSWASLQSGTNSGLESASIDSIRAKLHEANTQLEEMESAQKNVNRAAEEGTDAFGAMAGKIASAVGAIAGLNQIKSFVQGSFDLYDAQLNSEVQLAAVLANAVGDEWVDAYDRIGKKAEEIQKKGIYGNEAMIGAAAEFATYMSDTDAIEMMMDTLSNYAMGMTGGGAINPEQMVNYATNLGKIMTGAYDAMTKKGFEFTDAQKAIIEGSATEAEYIEALGADYQSMSEDVRAATVIADIINESWNGLYETMSQTPQAKMIQLKNTFNDLRETIGARLYPALTSIVDVINNNWDSIVVVIDGFTKAVGGVLNIAGQLLQVVANVANTIISNWSTIGPILKNVAIGFATIQAGIMAVRAAQMLWNLVMNPTVALYALIAALGFVLVQAAEKFTGLGHTAETVFGVISGAVFATGAFIWNTIAGVLNGLIQFAWTYFAEPWLGVFEWILNATQGGFNSFGDAVKNLLGNVISWFLSLGKVVTKIIDAIFGTDWTAGLSSLQDSVLAWGKNENAITLERKAPEVMKRIEYSAAYEVGAAFGDKIANTVSDMFDVSIANPDLDGIMFNTGVIADATEETASALSTAVEDLKYLRDIAERDVINRFTTAEVTVDMGGVSNVVNQNTDLDGMISYLADNVANALDMVREGAVMA